MSELIKKFFEADLTEAEEQALSEKLASSEEEAGEFLGIAEANYRRYGLPETSWPKTLRPPIGHGMGLGPFTSLLVVGLLGGLGYWFSTHSGWVKTAGDTLPGSSGAQGTLPGTLSAADRGEGRPAKAKPAQEAAPAQEQEGEFSIDEEIQRDMRQGGREAVEAVKKPHPETGRPAPALVPVNAADSPGRAFSDIAVKVNRKEPGPVSVRVLDMSGLEVAPLYSGNLGVGQWVFEWDGRLPDGNQASPGIYQVEVKSGSYRGSKNIRIR